VNRELLWTKTFVRAAGKYSKKNARARKAISETLEILAEDAFDPRLKTHKLKGNLADRWACTAGYDLRVLFRFVEHNGVEAILLLTVGTHDEVY